jgi:hypothetical protein
MGRRETRMWWRSRDKATVTHWKIQACISLGQGQLSALSRPFFMTDHPCFLLFAGAFLN